MDQEKILGTPDFCTNPGVPKVRSAAWFEQLELRKRQSDFENWRHFRYRDPTVLIIGQLATLTSDRVELAA